MFNKNESSSLRSESFFKFFAIQFFRTEISDHVTTVSNRLRHGDIRP